MLLFLLVLEVLAGPMLPVVAEELGLFEDELFEPGGRDLDLDLEPGECKDPEATDALIGDGVCLVKWEWE